MPLLFELHWVKNLDTHREHWLLVTGKMLAAVKSLGFDRVFDTYFAKKAKVNPKGMVVISVMPCMMKKFEFNRPETNDSGYQDVDSVLTSKRTRKDDKTSWN